MGSMIHGCVWLGLSLALLLVPPRAAAAPIPLEDGAGARSVLRDLVALADAEGTLEVDEVATRELRPVGELDLGLGRWPGERQPVVWLAFSVEVPAEGASEEWALVIGRPFDRGTVFLEEGSGRFRAIPLDPDASGRSFRAPLPREPGTRRVLIRVPGPLLAPSVLHVATPSGHERLLTRQLTLQGLYLGGMLAMLLVHLFVGLLLRDRGQLWYVGFLAASVATFSILGGTGSRFWLATTPTAILLRLQTASLAATVFAGIEFSRRFLDTPRHLPRFDRAMRAFLALTAVVFLLAGVAPDLLATNLVAALGLLVPWVALSAGVGAHRAGHRWARFYVVGWSVFSVGAILFAAPIAIGSLDGLAVFQGASAIEAALFSIALADRMRILREERARAERALANAQRSAADAEKLAALGQLVAGVAHEVSNPNNFLTFNLPILQDYLEALRPHLEAADRERGDLRLFGLTVDEFFADATTLVGNMQHGAERITGIVSQLKSYARRGDEAQWEEADVNRVVEAAATLVRAQLGRWVAHFELHLEADLPRVRMSPGRIEQVIMNLLLNAGHAAGTSGGGRVDVSTRREGEHVRIAVEDDGPGVPEGDRERIFEPFFTTKAGDQGTGMGLAISRRIVEEHGGTLELAGGAARGACFVVRLPIAAEPP